MAIASKTRMDQSPVSLVCSSHYKEFCEKTCDVLVTVRLNRAKRRLRPGRSHRALGRLFHSSRWGPGCPKPAVSKLSPHPAGRFSDKFRTLLCRRTSPLARHHHAAVRDRQLVGHSLRRQQSHAGLDRHELHPQGRPARRMGRGLCRRTSSTPRPTRPCSPRSTSPSARISTASAARPAWASHGRAPPAQLPEAGLKPPAQPRNRP